jgi:uncharacterized protein YbbC (DUF1343 family)
MWWDETHIPWVNPSPNLRSLEATLLYPGTVFFEGTNATEGRGTDKPFQLIGAEWLNDAGTIAREMNALGLRGVRFDSTSRTIDASGGYKVGVRLLRAIYIHHRAEWLWRPSIERLAGTDELRGAVEQGTIDVLLAKWSRESKDWQAQTRKYWIY